MSGTRSDPPFGTCRGPRAHLRPRVASRASPEALGHHAASTLFHTSRTRPRRCSNDRREDHGKPTSRARVTTAPGTDQAGSKALRGTRSRPDGMALARRRWRRRKVKAVRTWMACGQEAVVRVPPPTQLGVTRVDLDYLAELPVPSQPPPLVTAMRCGDERDVTAVVPRDKLTTDATLFCVEILGDGGQPQQFGGADGGHGSAANLLRPRPGEARHLAVTP